MVEQKVEIKRVEAVKVASLQARGMPFHKTVPEAFAKLMQWMAARGLPAAAGSPMGLAVYYDDPGAVAPQEVRFKVAVPVAPETVTVSDAEAAVEVLQARDVAYTTVFGLYQNLEQVYSRLGAWVYQNGYHVADAPREVYVRWGKSIPPAEWITEIQFPVER